MPWNDQSGDGSRGSGPWGGQGGNTGQRPRRPDAPRPADSPDLEEMLRRMQDRLRGSGFGGGSGKGGGPGRLGSSGFLVIGALLVAGWFSSGVYVVDAGENGVVTRFGKFDRLTEPGLHVHLPAPIEDVAVLKVTEQRSLQVGFRQETPQSPVDDRPAESLMLTGDESIIDVDFTVTWQLSDRPQDYVFNVKDPDELVLAVAESAMREMVGKTPLEPIISTGRSSVETGTRDLMQSMLDNYKSGVKILRVQLQRASAPSSVIEAFREVDRARADAETSINSARGDAARMIQEATAYREKAIREASGEAERFNLLYEQYRRNPRVTRERLYLETMERVYGGANKVIIDNRSGVTPYLPLDPLRRPAEPAARSTP